MTNMNKSQGPHPRIIVGLPDIQGQLRMVDRLSATAAEPELGRWSDLANLLSELYIQLQHKKQVTIYRSGSKNSSTAHAARQPGQKAGRQRR